jgi:hypothetical protein
MLLLMSPTAPGLLAPASPVKALSPDGKRIRP